MSSEDAGLREAWPGPAQSAQPTAGRQLPGDIARLVACMEANPFDPDLNAEVVKRRCGLRDNNVSSRFRHYVGASIREYLEALRLEAAARLLRGTSTTVLEVALSVGYNNVQTFYGAFRRRYACTPAAYRMGSDPIQNEAGDESGAHGESRLDSVMAARAETPHTS